MTEIELDRLLKQEESAFSKELEVERILKAFKLNPYDVLDIDYNASPSEIKKRYRQLSLFIHPDKTPHPKAPDAFDLLKKAESDLSAPEKREELDAVISAARQQVLKQHSLPPSITDPEDERIVEKGMKPGFKQQVRTRAKELFIEEELRRRRAVKMNLANEGLEAKKKEEETAAKKRKAEESVKWEENREQRVEGWRAFQQGPKKKKKKTNVLG
ncbi:DnaJ-domain-containing protein [Calocera viscosa TUFC12733]|uniref:DnaJ-domain-containing protein n=1 Tax=Calocera viscosa (strain TUFC12733) TaxID=1330018 RepID=A0A167R659_CALVF|nr:DnaJ-domain-containing protein [Calocera viscosa TUFC12733]